MKILLVTTDYLPNVSGIATLSHEQAIGLASLGHEVTVLTTYPGPGLSESTNPRIIRVANSFPPVIRLGNFFRLVLSAAKTHRPGYIWCTNYRGFGLPVMLVSRILNIPYGIYFHGTELITENRSTLRRHFIKTVARNAAGVCTNSQNSAQILANTYNFASSVATPGVHAATAEEEADLQAKAEIQRNLWLSDKYKAIVGGPVTIFAAACRMSRQKGIHTVLEAIATLTEAEKSQVLFVAIGSGVDQEQLKTLTRALNIDNHVHFHGPAANSDIPVLLRAADVYLQPSQPEGDFLESFGISFLEAQAAGLPCIATNWGGIPEAVIDGVTAVLVPPRSVEAVTEGIRRVLTETQWRKIAKREAMTWALRNSWKNHVITIDSLIAGLQPASTHE